MKIRFTKDWRGFTKGSVHDFGPGVCDAYIRYAKAAVEVDAQELNLHNRMSNGLEAIAVGVQAGATALGKRFKRKNRKGR